ncbi:ankyrin, partial [Anaeromyces robustus]
MYLIENGRHEELDKLLGKISNYDMSVKFNQVYVTILINQFKDIYINSKCKLIENYIKTMRVLNKYEYNFNVPIDEEGNTPFMFFMMIGDLCSCCFLLERFKRLDLSIKNKKGLSVSYLSLFIDSYENVFLKSLTEHPTFDYDYIDNNNNSLLMHYVVRNQYSDAEKAAIKSKRTLDHINNKNENILIIATKLGRLKEYFITPNNINHQDNLGNTPLAYALKLRDATFINLLMHNHADPYIMNYQGTSSIDLANEINESRILDILNKPLPPKEMEKKLQEDRKGFLFFDKKKSKEEKTDDYLKNYQINNYKEEYKDFLNSTTEWTYSNVIKDKPIESIIVGIYINLYMYSISAPKKLLMERDDRDFRRRMVYHGIAGGIDDMTIFGTKNRL